MSIVIDPAKDAEFLARFAPFPPVSRPTPIVVPAACFADKIRSGILDTASLQNLAPPAPLVDGLLNLDSLAVLYGPSGVSKTNTVVGITLSVAHGAWWMNRRVHGGRTLYIAGEGVHGVGMRARSWQQYHRLHEPQHGADWLPWAPYLNDLTQAAGLAEFVAEQQYALVVIDTLARSIPGAEESAAKDMGQVIAHLDMIRRASGACVLLVHHSGKDPSAGARGSSAIKAAMDTELELTGDATHLVLRTTKQKDAAPAAPIHLALKPVEGTDSVVVVPAGQGGDGGEHLDGKLADTLEALDLVATTDGVSVAVWLDSASQSGVGRTTFYRHVKSLQDMGLVRNHGTATRPLWTPVPPGQSTEGD